MKKVLLASLFSLVLTINATASDKSNNYAAKGYAALTCANFIKAQKTKTQDYKDAMTWFTGYITAYNSLAPDTYDIIPWQGLDLLSLMLVVNCEKDPKQSFLASTNRLINSLVNGRLQTPSQFISISNETQSIVIYKDIIFRIQSVLKEKGYLKSRWPNGDYDTATETAMKAFQAKEKITVSGLPDQQSLFNLFYK